MSGSEVCHACGHANPPGSQFCGGCGRQLIGEIACEACGATNPAAQRFCNQCGNALHSEADVVGFSDSETDSPTTAGAPGVATRLATPEHLAERIRADRGRLEGERKQVTVLFCDVVGSMELAEQTDPDAWRRVMERFFTVLSEGIHRFEGTVDKFTGDGAMALFGAPVAHEDHAQRACYAALALQKELADYAADLRRDEGLNISVRIGLNSGEVAVGAIGEDLAMDYTAVGHTVGLAQRMESLAEPGKTYLTEHSAKLVEGFVALDDLGEFKVKGSSQPLRVFELTGMGAARGRLDVSRARGLSRFVGRDEEMRMLDRALEDAAAGEASVIGIVGEAGVGKSRLCHELAERCRARGMPVYHATGQAHTKAVPLLPVLQLMRDYFDITDHDSEQTARERIAGKLLLLDESFADDLPLIFEFLAVPDPERPPPRMDPEAKQRQLLELTRRLIRAQSAREPGLTLLEDLHWIDPASEAFLATNVEAIRGTKSLTVVNFRPEYRADWMSKSYYRQIALVPLGPEAADEMLAGLLGSHPSLDGLPEVIRERTGGNPFFMEELVQSLVELGNLEGVPGSYELVQPVEETAVPGSVQAVLAARIDRLTERDKDVLQRAAVIGKEFSRPVLERVAETERAELDDTLRSLVASEFVFEQELYPDPIYAFRHPLTQEVAYRSQLSEHRATTHAAVAHAIAEQNPERHDELAALLAEHWEAAGEGLEAARWHARAAAWTGTRDPTHSLEHWRQVRELADGLPESGESTALALTARILTLQFAWRLGVSHEEAEQTFEEAEAIARRTGDIRSRAILLTTYAAIRGTVDGEPRAMVELARQALALAEEAEDPALYMTVVQGAYGFFVVGELEEAVAVLRRGIELADNDPSVGAGIGVQCPLAFAIGFKGGFVGIMGRISEGLQQIERGATLAREQDDIETLGWCLIWKALLSLYADGPDAMLGHAQRALEIAERIGDAFSRCLGWYWVGGAYLELGDFERAAEALERSQAISNERRTARETEPYRLAWLGAAYAGRGDVDRGRALIEEGLELARRRGQRAAEAMLSSRMARSLRGSLDATGAKEVEAIVARGLEAAEETKMRLVEPELHAELAELARVQGDEERHQRELHEAHRLYAEVGATARAERLAGELATLAG